MILLLTKSCQHIDTYSLEKLTFFCHRQLPYSHKYAQAYMVAAIELEHSLLSSRIGATCCCRKRDLAHILTQNEFHTITGHLKKG